MNAIFVLLNFLIFIEKSFGGCSGPIDPSNLVLGFQQQQGQPNTTSLCHLLTSTTPYTNFACSRIINGIFLSGPVANCSSSCLVELTPYQYNNGSREVDIVMLRPQDVGNYPGYTVVQNASKMYCVTNKGDCGATIPLYEFYSEEYEDHYASTDYINSDPSYNKTGILCYLLPVPTDNETISVIESRYSSNDMTCNVPKFSNQTLYSSTTSPSSSYNENDTTPWYMDESDDCCEWDGVKCCKNDDGCDYDHHCERLWVKILIYLGCTLASFVFFFLLCCILCILLGTLCSKSNKPQRTVNPYENGNIYRINVYPSPAPVYPTHSSYAIYRFVKF